MGRSRTRDRWLVTASLSGNYPGVAERYIRHRCAEIRWLAMAGLYATGGAPAISWASLVNAAPQTLYVSNEASNGYGLGDDTTGDGTIATPYLTIKKALTVGVDGVAIQVNATSTPYIENSGSGYFRPGATKAFFIGSPSGTFVLQGVAATGAQALFFDASAKRMVFYNCFVDGAGTTSNRCVSGLVSMTGGVEFYYGGFRNASTSAIITPTGTGTKLTLYGCDIESTVHFVMSGTGGNYGLFKAWGCTFAQDNQVLKGSASGVWTTVSVRYNSFVQNGAGTGLGIIFGGDTIGDLDFSDNVATGLFGGYILQVSSSTTVTGQLIASRNTGNPNKGMFYVVSENVADFLSEDNDVTAIATQTADPIRVQVLGAKGRVRRNIVRVFATAQVHGFAFGGDGFATDVSNIATAATTMNLGDVSDNVYRSIKFVRPAATTNAVFVSNLACVLVKMKKAGAPTGTIVFDLYTNNAGAPGTLITTSPTVINAADLLTTGTGLTIETRHIMFPDHYKMAASTTYHVVARYTGTVDGTNYVTFATNTTVTTGNVSASPDNVTWTADATHQAWFEVDTGSFATTDFIAEDNACIIDATANATTHGFMIGSFEGPISRRNRVVGGGICHLFKNTYNPVAYDLAGAASQGVQAALYLKGVINAKVYQSTFIQSSSTADTAAAILVGSNSELGVNAPISTGELKNSVIVNNGIGSPYNYDVGAVFTTDYNLLYGLSLVFPVERQSYLTYPTFAAWKAAGRDVHSVYANPLLTVTSPVNAIDFVLPANSPAAGIGTDVSAYVTTDFNGATFTNPPPAGAFNVAAA